MRVLKLSRLVTVMILIAAFALDALGTLLDRPALWTAGAHASTAGVWLGVLLWMLAWFSGRRGQIIALFALACCALARFLRGSAGVPPDLPLLVMAGLGSLLMLWSWWRWRRAMLPMRSHADARPPA